MSQDECFINFALEEALKGKETVAPNPMVGAVIVEDGEIVAKGFHQRSGEPHAECIALSNLKRRPKLNAIMYVTLEPCSSLGKTGACTDVIIAAGIKTVVIGTIDPNPTHQGKGIDILREADVTVRSGILKKECAAINTIFNEAMEKLSSG